MNENNEGADWLLGHERRGGQINVIGVVLNGGRAGATTLLERERKRDRTRQARSQYNHEDQSHLKKIKLPC